jgi:MFS family permease
MQHEPTALTSSDRPASLGVRDQVTLSFFWFALNFQGAALMPIIIPAQIILFITPGLAGSVQQAVFLGWLAAAGAVISLVVQPLVGALSDRTPGPLGRRRPYIIFGTLIVLGGIAALGTSRELTIFVAGFLAFHLGSNIATAAYQSLLPDRVPEGQRGAASGYMGLMTILGTVGSLALAAVLLGAAGAGVSAAEAARSGSMLFYALSGGILLFGLILTVVGIRELPLGASRRAQRGLRAGGRLAEFYQRTRAVWLDPWQNHNFTWVVLTRAFVMLGLTLFMTYILYYFARVAKVTNYVQATAGLAALALGGAVLSALFLGIISDRFRRVPIVCVATALMTSAALAFVIAPEKVPLWPLGIVFGLGYGAYTSVDWALAVDALPSLMEAGKDLGLWNIASTVPGVLAPLLGSLIIATTDLFGLTAQGYRVVFGAAAFFLLLGAASVVKVRERRDVPPTLDTIATDLTPSPAEASPASAVLTPAPHAPITGPNSPRNPARGRQRRLGGWRLASRTGAGHAAGFLRFWPVWERINSLFHPLHAVPGAPYNLFLTRFGRYHGRPMTLPDGTTIRSGDRVLELHANNHFLAQLSGGLALVRQARGDLAALAAWTLQPEYPVGVRAIYGFTMLSRGLPRLGFTVRDRRVTLYVRLQRFYFLGLMALYHGHGLERLREGTTLSHYPQEIWMSIDELRRRYSQS